jgi:hypothetical protein
MRNMRHRSSCSTSDNPSARPPVPFDPPQSLIRNDGETQIFASSCLLISESVAEGDAVILVAIAGI